ncbi:MAG: AsmA family protein, partial [Proteobacteria bacterium]|nr:AsmA family protein [Pseudomonadota bacterium]
MSESTLSRKYRQNRVILGGIALVMFLVGLALVMQGLIDTRNFRDELTRIIQLQTKRKVAIRGNVSVSLLPTPTLFVPGVELRDPAVGETAPTPSATVDMIKIQVSLLSLLSQDAKITHISFEHPVLEVVRAEDNLIHWGWVNSSLLEAMSDRGMADSSMSVDISNGRIIYRDISTEEMTKIESINLHVVNGRKLNIGGGFTTYGHAMNFTLDTDSVSGNDLGAERPVSFNMSSDDNSTLNLQGTLAFKDELPVVKGKLVMNLEDAMTWVQAREGDKSSLFDAISGKQEEKKSQRPLKLSGDWEQTGLTGELKDLRIEGLNSAGIGNLMLTWKDWKPAISADLHFSAIEYYNWEHLIQTAFFRPEAVLRRMYHTSDEDHPSPLPRNVVLNFKIKADEVYFGDQSWHNANLSSSLADGAVTVNEFSIDLPGESSLTLFGVISPSATQDLRFEGSMETRGSSLRNMLTVLDSSAAELPEMGFGSFFAHSNIFISNEQLRLSEADVKLSDLHLNGGMVFYFDEQPRLEADVRLKNINFDYFRDAWRERESKNIDKGKDFFLKFDKNMNFNWLRKLTTTIDFRVGVDRFTFLEHPGTTASFRIYARQGDLGIYDINFIYPTDIMRGTFRLNVMGEKPLFNLSFSASEINTDYFSYENSFMAEEEKRKRMEEEERKLEEALMKAEQEKKIREKAARSAAARQAAFERGEITEAEYFEQEAADAAETAALLSASGTATLAATSTSSIISQNPDQPITEAKVEPGSAADGALK